MEQVSIRNLKVKVEVLLQDRLEKIQKGIILLNVNTQFDEMIIEQALQNFDKFEEQAETWQKEGVDLHAVPVMVWAHRLKNL